MDKKFYCYKVKRNSLRKGDLGNLGFAFYVPVDEDSENQDCFWARPIELDPKGKIAGFLKFTIEKFYNNGKCSETMLKEVNDSGYEFGADGKLIENDAFLSGLKGQLCVSVAGANTNRGVLFINIEGIEFYDTDTLLSESALADIVKTLLDAKVIYRKKLEYYAD